LREDERAGDEATRSPSLRADHDPARDARRGKDENTGRNWSCDESKYTKPLHFAERQRHFFAGAESLRSRIHRAASGDDGDGRRSMRLLAQELSSIGSGSKFMIRMNPQCEVAVSNS
jgi:hypothetical protein